MSGIPSDNYLRKLAPENDKVQGVRNRTDLLERMIRDESGNDLRHYTRMIGELVMQIADELELFAKRQQAILEARSSTAVAAVAPSSFAKKQLTPDDKDELKRMFARCLDGNPNDDKARTAQLQIVFAALTLLFDVRNQLTEKPEHVERFHDVEIDSAPMSVAERKKAVEAAYKERQRQNELRANLIPTGPLNMWLKKDALDLWSRLLDKKLTTQQYVEQCCNTYMQYKPTMTAEIVRRYRTK